MTNDNNETAYPPVRSEIAAQIVALDCLLADLILKCQGNARELDELVGVLDAHLACCEEARDSLMGFDDNLLTRLDMTDLPADQQRLILESAVFGGVALETLRKLTHADVEFLMQQLSDGVKIITGEMSDQKITEILDRYLKVHRQNISNLVICGRFQSPDNN